MDLSRTVSEIDSDFDRKLKNFPTPTPLYFAPPLKRLRLELGTGTGGSENYNDGATGPTKKFDDIFSGLDTIHQRDRRTYTDRQTDRQALGNSKDRAYA